MSIVPMMADNIEAWLERSYREGGRFQWVRETTMNAIEAGATQVEFGIEWQAVEKLGIYRRRIADNGLGMSATDLVSISARWEVEVKPIGGRASRLRDRRQDIVVPLEQAWCDRGLMEGWRRQHDPHRPLRR